MVPRAEELATDPRFQFQDNQPSFTFDTPIDGPATPVNSNTSNDDIPLLPFSIDTVPSRPSKRRRPSALSAPSHQLLNRRRAANDLPTALRDRVQDNHRPERRLSLQHAMDIHTGTTYTSSA